MKQKVVMGAVLVLALGVVSVSGWTGLWGPSVPAPTTAAAQPAAEPTTKKPKAKPARLGPRVLFGEILGASPTNGQQLVVGAHVEAIVAGGNIVADARSGADGQFTLDDLPADLRALRFSAPGFVSVDVDVGALPSAEEAFWSQQLVPAGEALRIVVVGAEDGQPLAHVAVVGLQRGGPHTRPRWPELGVTDAGGVVALVPALEQVLVVVDARRGSHELTTGERNLREVRVALPAPAILRGRVVDEQGRAVGAATFLTARAWPASAAEAALTQLPSPWQQTDAEGLFVVEVAAGTVSVQASAPGFRPGDSGEVKVAAGLDTEVVVELVHSPRVSGVVVDAHSGKGIGLCTVSPDGGAQGARSSPTNNDGAFVLDSLIDRPSSLQVVCAGYRNLTLGGLDGGRSRQDDVRIEMRRGEGDVVVGIGVVLRPAHRGVGVRSVQAETPAARAGLLRGEVIEAVDDVDLSSEGQGLPTAMALIRGQPDSSLRLRIRAIDNSTRVVELRRGLIDIPVN